MEVSTLEVSEYLQQHGQELQQQPAPTDPQARAPAATIVAPESGPATSRPNSSGGAAGDDTNAFVYDVYVPVPDEEMGGDREGGNELWPWADAPSGADFAAPIIEVAEDDDEFFWAGELEAEAAQRAAAAEEHDSEDSNAESYYANSYPDEEDAPYDDYYGGSGADSDSDLDGGAGPRDAGLGGGYSWGAALAMRRDERPDGGAEDDDGDDADADEDDALGRRRGRVGVSGKKVSSYYRTEEDDYSEHSSYLSEEEERREAEERRRRAVMFH
ncbi:hypothetical protein GPECTOR_69g428 [Gonium pectorale]|uniref:Transcription factor Iwr1 domain-containing protein n=1 Tax=Gonium pectorale TaxID=33097 RepID=A0A150G486_GONPE|nr:hypothetical protein GPECTOR_69g428 [Gonium pectorale]|eukprot:KXZ44335.1 hypothetical protein GPECTOR_69g428 [Gonium pectorale]